MFRPVRVLDVKVPVLLLSLPESSTFNVLTPLAPFTTSGAADVIDDAAQ